MSNCCRVVFVAPQRALEIWDGRGCRPRPRPGAGAHQDRRGLRLGRPPSRRRHRARGLPGQLRPRGHRGHRGARRRRHDRFDRRRGVGRGHRVLGARYRRPRATSETSWPPSASHPNAAAYQDYATLSPASLFYRIPDHVDPEWVIAFGCAMPTAVGGNRRLGGIQPGQTVVVQGCGPVGLASTFLAGLSAARQIIVIGAPDHRLAAAHRLGATRTMPLESTTVDERLDAVRQATEGRGADVVLECAGRNRRSARRCACSPSTDRSW